MLPRTTALGLLSYIGKRLPVLSMGTHLTIAKESCHERR